MALSLTGLVLALCALTLALVAGPEVQSLRDRVAQLEGERSAR